MVIDLNADTTAALVRHLTATVDSLRVVGAGADSLRDAVRGIGADVDSLRMATDSVRAAVGSLGHRKALAEWLALAVALLAVFFGPVIQLRIARRQMTTQLDLGERQMTTQLDLGERQMKTQLATAERQIKSAVLSGNRQKWIDQLRLNIAQFMALALDAFVQDTGKDSDHRTFVEKTVRLKELQYTIDLLLNPKESDHEELAGILQEVSRILGRDSSSDRTESRNDLMKAVADIKAKAQPILKKEWERVKTLD